MAGAHATARLNDKAPTREKAAEAGGVPEAHAVLTAAVQCGPRDGDPVNHARAYLRRTVLANANPQNMGNKLSLWKHTKPPAAPDAQTATRPASPKVWQQVTGASVGAAADAAGEIGNALRDKASRGTTSDQQRR